MKLKSKKRIWQKVGENQASIAPSKNIFLFSSQYSFTSDSCLGFRYGKSLVPFLNVDQQSMKLEAEKCLDVLCFTPLSCVSKKLLA